MTQNTDLARLQSVKETIARCAEHHGRPPGEIRLVAVSKTVPADRIKALADAGHKDFGENYAQELADKARQLQCADITWHYIGALQSNKARLVATTAHWVHSLDRVSIAEKLHRHRPRELPPLNVLVQINIDHETHKAGIPVADLLPLARAVADLPQLRLRGVMTLPPRGLNAAQQHQRFTAVQACLLHLREHGFDVDTVSMGMSNDFETAIAAGSTMVRIGTAVFGPRPPGLFSAGLQPPGTTLD